MGRWGYRMFEGDVDLDFACEINGAFGEGPAELELSHMIHQTDMLAPAWAKVYFGTGEYRDELAERVDRVRKQLNAGLCDRLFYKYRALEDQWNGKYRVVVVAALMMRAGAFIKQDNLDHARELANEIPGKHGFVWPLAEEGFRYAGKVQFLAALDNYKPGTPRDFNEPSCFHCGKVCVDIGKTPKKCGKCESAWYCNADCQKAQWKNHKSVCKPLSQRHSLNV
ncbi:hypothetical protein C8035_v000478 [Colletotrichum spinosum]|uniref:MYND-type domain-containing protein n=1 Tax=Colletotrichum spinosum TaxID=1347390 RepID=A0A4R8PLH3_9PEZI|nr:hypothetical protein C8035_v000478 [Colletotrichum spinosum]